MCRVTFLLTNNYFGGVARVIIEFAKELLKRGYKVTVVVPIVPYWQFHRHVTFRNFSRMKKIGVILLSILKSLYFEWKQRRFRWVGQDGLNVEVKRYLLKPADNLLYDADWLFLNIWYQIYDISNKGVSRKRIIQFIYHYEEPNNKELEKLILNIYKSQFLKVTESKFTANVLVSKGVKADKIIHLGINKNYFYPRISEPESLKILMYYDTEKRKGASIGIESLEKIKSIFSDIGICLFSPIPTKFLLNGYSLKFSLSDEKLAELYRAHSIFVFPSLLEGFALPPLEAMACACAVVTTRVGAVEEYAVNMENAIIVEPGDANAIKKAVELLLRDNDLRKRISHNAAIAASRFTWDKSVDELEKLFTEFLAKSKH